MVTEDAAKVSRNATVVSENAAQMTSLFSATLGGPLVKTAAFSYGIRKAIVATAQAARRSGVRDSDACSGSLSARASRSL